MSEHHRHRLVNVRQDSRFTWETLVINQDSGTAYQEAAGTDFIHAVQVACRITGNPNHFAFRAPIWVDHPSSS
jgi:hypothetical protein